MMTGKKRFLALALAGVCMMGAVAGCGKSTEADKADGDAKNAVSTENEEEKSVYGDLKKFTCTTLDGGTFSEKDLAGKDLTVINFWMTSCGPCVAEIPDLEEYRKTLPDNVQLILISLDNEAEAASVKKVLSETGYTGTTAFCGDEDMEALSRNIMYVPTTLFFDSEGRAKGSGIIGGQPDLAGTYTRTINKLLSNMKKDAIWKN